MGTACRGIALFRPPKRVNTEGRAKAVEPLHIRDGENGKTRLFSTEKASWEELGRISIRKGREESKEKISGYSSSMATEVVTVPGLL